MSTYLVTGAAGFIASKVCEQLLAAGHRVVGVDNLNDYYDVRLKDWRLSQLMDVSCQLLGSDPKKSVFANIQQRTTNNAGTFIFHHLDIEDMSSLEKVFAAHKFDAVFNLAARAGVRYSLEFPELYRRTNILGEENVLKCQVKYGVKKHVLASSSSVYAGCPMPFVESASLGRMQSPYAETKRAAELLAKEYHERHGIDVTVLRYFTVFGPAGRPDMAPFRFIKWIDEGTPITLYGDGNQARDFTYIDDIARGTIDAIKPLGWEIINLGGGNTPVTLHDMIKWIEKGFAAVGREAIAKTQNHVASTADMAATWADITKAKRLLDWTPRIMPAEGFQRTLTWFLNNKKWIRNIRL